MNKLDLDYKELLKDILKNGTPKNTRNGKVISVFGRQIRHNMRDGFPLLTTKKVPFRAVVTELLWFLNGGTNIKYLVENNCNIWNGDAYKHYEMAMRFAKKMQSSVSNVSDFKILTEKEFVNEIKTNDDFAKKWGELGPIYGKQWRGWGGGAYKHYVKEQFKSVKEQQTKMRDNNFNATLEPNILSEKDFFTKIKTDDDFAKKWGGVDQISNLVNDLKNDPDSRRLMVNAWNVGEIDDMVLPPCHFGFQCFTRELTYKERYDYWFSRNYETGMEVNYKIQPDFNNPYYTSTPERAISLMWYQRSVDTFLGLPFNIASYGVLLQLLAEECNMVPEELIGNLGDTHLYLNHLEQANEQIGHDYTFQERFEMLGKIDNIDLPDIHLPRYLSPNYSDLYVILMDENNIPKNTRESFPLPTLIINTEFWNPEKVLGDDYDAIIKMMEIDDFQIQNYQSHEAIKAPLSN